MLPAHKTSPHTGPMVTDSSRCTLDSVKTATTARYDGVHLYQGQLQNCAQKNHHQERPPNCGIKTDIAHQNQTPATALQLLKPVQY